METHPQTRRVWVMNTLGSCFSKLLTSLIRAYQYLLSPWLGNNCRFTPSCSHYAIEAIQTHGPLCGVGLSAKRLCKCHPWHTGGFDPVPKVTISEK